MKLKIEAFYNSQYVNQPIIQEIVDVDFIPPKGFSKSEKMISFAENLKIEICRDLKQQTIEKLDRGFDRYGVEYKSSKVEGSSIYMRIVCMDYPKYNAKGRKLKSTTEKMLYSSDFSAEMFSVPTRKVEINEPISNIFKHAEHVFDGANLYTWG